MRPSRPVSLPFPSPASAGREGTPGRALALAALAFVLAGPTPARADDAGVGPSPVPARIAEVSRTDGRALELLDELVNGIGPRLTGSANLARAEEWALQRFAELGLPAHLHRWGEIEVGFERGPSSGGVIAPDAQPLPFITRAWSAGTDGPRRGPARLPPDDEQAFATAGETLAGAWVLLAPTPRGGPPDDDARARQQRLGELLESVPVAGLVRRSPSGERLVMSGSFRVTWDELPAVPTVTLTAPAFDELGARVAAGEHIELLFDIDNRFVRGPIAQHNVVAELRGRQFPEQCVILGAHLDSWDGATGTTDDGTGVAAVLEAARLLRAAGAQPARSIRFVLFGGEEQGLHGSRAYVQAHEDELAGVSAALVLDEGTNPITGLHVTPAMEDVVRQALAPLAALLSDDPAAPAFTLAVVDGLPRDGSSDHAPFKNAGVPGFFFVQEGPAVYSRTHHTQHDTFDAADPPSLQHNALVLALSAWGLAELPEPLPRRGLLRPLRRLGVFLADDGVTVTALAGEGQATQLGVQPGDVFAAVNGEPVGGDGPSLAERRDAGEPRKLIAWRRGEALHEAVFAWHEPFGERDPERVLLAREDGGSCGADYVAGSPAGPLAGAAVVLLPRAGEDHDEDALRKALHEAGVSSLRLHAAPHAGCASPPRAEVSAALAWLAGLRHEPSGVLGATPDLATLVGAAPSP